MPQFCGGMWHRYTYLLLGLYFPDVLIDYELWMKVQVKVGTFPLISGGARGTVAQVFSSSEPFWSILVLEGELEVY